LLFLMFSSYFHYWILILILVLSRYEWTNFVSISFTTFSLDFRLEYRIKDFVFTTFDVDVETNVNFATTYNKPMDKK
jgi:hypothetical protein